ncbi:MAG: Rid family detoxifying hydrolase [Clostridia bacterium]|nr:Rid family detoxifying hydrolase [Clostridia bacterium]
MKTIETKKAPAAIGPYSQAIVTGGLVYTSGQIPIDPATGLIEASGIEEQTKQVIANLAAVLAAANSSLDRVVKTTCFLKNISDFAAFNAIYAQYFTGRPARSCVEVCALPKDALVEIEVVAEAAEAE